MLPFAIEAAIALALVTHLVWSWCRPSRCIGRLSRWLMGANAAAWLAFLVVTPPVPQDVFADIEARRDAFRRDGGTMTIDLSFDVPTIVAGRYSGTFGPVNEADRLLIVFAGPARDFADQVRILVARPHLSTRPTRGESYATAGIALVLSMAFWNALGAGVHFWRARRRARASTLDPPAAMPAP